MNATFKTTAALVLGLALTGPVMANGGATAVVGGVGATSHSTQGNSQGVNITTNNEAADLGDAVPTAVAPALTTTLSETCMGSTSAGASGSGFGLSFGSTWTDDECVRRLNAREVRSMGFALAAKELMCDNDDVRAAFERTAKMTGNADLLCQSTADTQEKTAGKIDTNRYVETENTSRIGGERSTFVANTRVETTQVAEVEEAPVVRRNSADLN